MPRQRKAFPHVFAGANDQIQFPRVEPEDEFGNAAEFVKARKPLVEDTINWRVYAEGQDQSEEKNDKGNPFCFPLTVDRGVKGEKDASDTNKEACFPEETASPVKCRFSKKTGGEQGNEVFRRKRKLRSEFERQRESADCFAHCLAGRQ